MSDDSTMKFVLTILCSLMFLWRQVAAMASPVACASQPARHCCHAGTMPCCATSPASVPQVPVTATVPAGSQQQILSPVPAAVVWGFAAHGPPSVSPGTNAFLWANEAPLFQRHLSCLIS